MYLLSLHYQNARLNGHGRFSPKRRGNFVAKWTLLPACDRNLELLRLIAASCNSPPCLGRIPFPFPTLRSATEGPLVAAHLRVLHTPTDHCKVRNGKAAGGVHLDPKGEMKPLSRTRDGNFFPDFIRRNPSAKSRTGRDFLLAYGDEFSAHENDDDFDFTDPLFRSRRIQSLFTSSFPLTDPVAFLNILFHRGLRNKRLAPRSALERICGLLQKHLALDLDHWLQSPADAGVEWDKIPTSLRNPILLLLDAVRHTLDAFPKAKTPLDLPGLILMHRPHRYCEKSLFSAWLALVDELFPNMQFLFTATPAEVRRVPENLLGKRLPLPAQKGADSVPSIRAGKVDVLLVDVDGRLPNLALMKLSSHFQTKGRRVLLTRRATGCLSAREVYASCIFTRPASSIKIMALRDFYGDSLQLGGSGIDPRGRLPAEIEALPPDYRLYPELGDRAIGFLSRGCPRRCRFCIVPLKEGPPRQVSDLETLLEGGRRKKLILLDDNLLSLPQADRLLEEMASWQIMVNFTQTLDLRLVDRTRATLLRRISCSNTRFTRRNYHFSLNDCRNLERLRKKYDLFGFSSMENVEFICMYGYNTTLAEDLERFRFLRSLPGAYVFTQKYQPIPGGPSPHLADFFEGDPDSLISNLIKIEFKQNMKSMENYYRWVSRMYAETFGKLHMPLVDTIFRYNQRDLRGKYLATLAGLNR